nr:hypothetical protein [Tanacetum cinerariifolium]
MKNQNNELKNMMRNELKNMMSSFIQIHSPSGSGSLPSNTVANPRCDMKAITTQNCVAYEGLLPPTSSSLPKEVEREPEATKDKFASSFKSLLSNKEELFELASTPLNENYSAVLLKKLPEKLGDPGKFLIPCDFSELAECLALAGLGASINLMPLSIWKKLSITELTPTHMTLELANRSVTYLVGVAEDVFVKVGKFYFSGKFVVVDYDVDPRVPLILGRPFLKTARALIDVYREELTLRVNDEAITDRAFLRTPDELSHLDDDYYNTEGDILYLEKLLNEDPFSDLLSMKNGDLKQVDVTMTKPSIEEPPELELKDLPFHLKYALLEGTNKLPIIISKELKDEEKATLLKALKLHKRAIAWKIFDIKGIDSHFCTHKILMEDDFKLEVQHQRRVNPKIHEVIKKEVIKILDVRCMMAIFHDMIEETMKVFIDDFSIFRDSFSSCLSHLDKMLKRCEDTNLVLNWEKCHFMVKEGILLGHAGFYRQFIQDFSKIARPITHLLEKETSFIFSKECIEAFNTLKKKLTKSPILVALDWDLSFEIMCDASDFAIASSESHLPMLNKENYVPWSSRLLRYAKSRPNGKLIHNSILNGPYVRKMIPEPGDANRDITVTETFHLQTDDELSEKEFKQIKADDQAIQTILLGLPEDIYAAVDSCETAQEIWLRVQQMMKGSDIRNQEKKAKLFNE